MTSPLALLSLDSRVGPEALRFAAAELAAAGAPVPAEDLLRALRAARAFQNPVTLEWEVPGAAPPAWPYDDLQDAVMDRTGLRGAALSRAWMRVKGKLRLRWAEGNRERPLDATAARWAREAA